MVFSSPFFCFAVAFSFLCFVSLELYVLYERASSIYPYFFRSLHCLTLQKNLFIFLLFFYFLVIYCLSHFIFVIESFGFSPRVIHFRCACFASLFVLFIVFNFTWFGRRNFFHSILVCLPFFIISSFPFLIPYEKCFLFTDDARTTTTNNNWNKEIYTLILQR